MDCEAGFSIHEGVFSAAEIRALQVVMNALPLPYSRAGARHLLCHGPIDAIARDPRLLAIAARWLNAAAEPFRATLFDKGPDANWLVAWHQDTALPVRRRSHIAGWGPWSIKQGVHYAHAPGAVLERVISLRLHLDDSTDGNGPLRVLPGTHRHGVLSDAQVRQYSAIVEARSCCAPAGGVVALRPLLIHASSKSTTDLPRRILHFEYCASLQIAPGTWLRVA